MYNNSLLVLSQFRTKLFVVSYCLTVAVTTQALIIQLFYYTQRYGKLHGHKQHQASDECVHDSAVGRHRHCYSSLR